MSYNFFEGENDYSENTRAIDTMLSQFQKDRKIITDFLEKSPEKLVSTLWKVGSPLSKDDECLFHMGKSISTNIDDMLLKPPSITDSLINFYICPQCKNMKRLIDFSIYKKTNIGEPFLLECGEKAGQSLCYEEKNVQILYLNLEALPYSVKKAYTNPFIVQLAQCSSATCAVPSQEAGSQLLLKYLDTEYLGSDPFTNDVLINYYLNEILLTEKNPNILLTNISFVCNDNGYNINEYLDIGTIQNFQEFPEFLETNGKPSPTAKADDKSPINKEVCTSIIKQLFACLHTLRPYDFSHGTPSTSNLKFKKEIVSYIHDGVLIAGPITLKLCDFSTSGITILRDSQNHTNNQKNRKYLRLYSKSVVGDEELKKKTYEPIILTEKSSVDNSSVTIYKLKNPVKCIKSSILFMYMKHLGLPVYAASFDAYSLMMVLMTERSFYTTVISTFELNKLWRSMWINTKDYEKINERIKEFHERSRNINIDDVLKLLSDLSLRCDMIDFGWNIIKNMK